MNREQFQGKWHQLKGKVREKWGRLTDNDVTQINGRLEQLSGKLQMTYGWEKERADREIDAWCQSCEKAGRKDASYREESRFTERDRDGRSINFEAESEEDIYRTDRNQNERERNQYSADRNRPEHEHRHNEQHGRSSGEADRKHPPKKNDQNRKRKSI